jgi:hypothetical protein
VDISGSNPFFSHGRFPRGVFSAAARLLRATAGDPPQEAVPQKPTAEVVAHPTLLRRTRHGTEGFVRTPRRRHQIWGYRSQPPTAA